MRMTAPGDIGTDPEHRLDGQQHIGDGRPGIRQGEGDAADGRGRRDDSRFHQDLQLLRHVGVPADILIDVHPPGRSVLMEEEDYAHHAPGVQDADGPVDMIG